MRLSRLAAMLTAGALASACSYTPPKVDDVPHRVSTDYLATGAAGVRAYVYGVHTLLETDGSSVYLSVYDETGASVDFERIGKYYRLARRLDAFTTSTSNGTMTFTAVKSESLPAPGAIQYAGGPAVRMAMLAVSTPARMAADEAFLALQKRSAKQLDELRRMLDAAGANPQATGEELFAVNARLDDIAVRLKEAAAVVRVSFPTGSTQFTPSRDLAKVLVPAAKGAEEIHIRGHTDVKVASPGDARLAIGRAMSARRYLIDKGVSPNKIDTSAQAAGDFVVPNLTKEARAVNRRVEIELVSKRAAQLKFEAAARRAWW